MVTITMDANSLVKSLGNVSTNLSKELGIVTWKTSKKTKSAIAKEVTKELAVAQKVIKKQISAKRIKPKLGALVTLNKTDRISLKRFKARQTKRGVSYKISKTAGRQTIPDAFGPNISKLGKHVYKRKHEYVKGGDGYKNQMVGQKLMGASPWGAFVKQNMIQPVVKLTRVELLKQLKERIRWNTLKQSGGV